MSDPVDKLFGLLLLVMPIVGWSAAIEIGSPPVFFIIGMSFLTVVAVYGAGMIWRWWK